MRKQKKLLLISCMHILIDEILVVIRFNDNKLCKSIFDISVNVKERRIVIVSINRSSSNACKNESQII